LTRASDDRYVDRWWRANGRYLLLMLVLAVPLVIFYPAELTTKLWGAALPISVFLLGSLLYAPRSQKVPTRKEIFRSVAERESGPLPATSKIDDTRTLLAVNNSTEDPVVYLVYFEGLKPRMYLVPSHLRGRARETITFESIAEAREGLQKLGIGVLPQSDFTDRIGRELRFDE
jgi:hypothetical protein